MDQINKIIRILRYGKKEQRLILLGVAWFCVFKFVPKENFEAIIKPFPDWVLWIGSVFILWAVVIIWRTAIKPTPLQGPPKPSAIKGAMSFNDNDDDGELFANLGRTTELQKILDHILNPGIRFIVVMGESGAGKTSFLRAGLAYSLRKSYDRYNITPIYWEALPSDPIERLSKTIAAKFQLTENLNIAKVLPNGLCEKNMCIILDQFEQLSQDNHPEFFSFLQEIITSEKFPNITWVVAFREEYAANWWKFTEQIKDFYPPMISIEQFSHDKEKEIVVCICEKANITLELKVLSEFVSSISDKGKVSPVDIGIGLDVLSELKKEDNGTTLITYADYESIGESEGLLRNYIEKKFKLLPPEHYQKLLTVLLSLIDPQNPMQRIAAGKEVQELSEISGLEEPRLKSHLKFLASSQARLLEQIPPLPEEAQAFRLVHERFIPAINRLKGIVLAAAEKAEMLLNDRYSSWLKNKGNRYLLTFAEYLSIRKYKKIVHFKTNEKDKQDFVDKSFKRIKVQLSIWLILACLLLLGLYRINQRTVDANNRKSLYSMGLPEELYDYQEQLDTLEITSNAINNLDWLKGHFYKLGIDNRMERDLANVSLPNSIRELRLNVNGITDYQKVKWPDNLTDLDFNFSSVDSSCIMKLISCQSLTNIKLINPDLSVFEYIIWPSGINYQFSLSMSDGNDLRKINWPKDLTKLKLDVIHNFSFQFFHPIVSEIKWPEKLTDLIYTAIAPGFYKGTTTGQYEYVTYGIGLIDTFYMPKKLINLELDLSKSATNRIDKVIWPTYLTNLHLHLSTKNAPNFNDIIWPKSLSKLQLDISNNED